MVEEKKKHSVSELLGRARTVAQKEGPWTLTGTQRKLTKEDWDENHPRKEHETRHRALPKSFHHRRGESLNRSKDEGE